MFGNITLKCRPLRLAFLISPDKAALRAAIQMNSTLWGGTYNPIIPLYGQSPKPWRMYPGQRIATKDRVAGYVRAFDPDLLVDCTGGKLPAYVADFGRPTISIDDIWSNFFSDQRDGAPKYGVGVFELMHGIYKEYFEVVRRVPSKAVFPIFPTQHALFWAATVGELPDPIQQAVETEFAQAIDIEKPVIGPENYESIMRSHVFLPRNITRHQLETEGRGSHRSYAFYMDATKFIDIVDFWNLRALGPPVVPVPKQFVAVTQYISYVKNFIRDRYTVNRFNPSVTYGTNVIRSYSSTMPELQALATVLQPDTIIPDKPDARVLALQH